jgi:hypothetical protein
MMNKKVISFILCIAITVCAAFFFSCNDTLFWENVGMFSEIEKEIKLEEGVVKGNVHSIVEFGGKIYAGAGLIYVKNKSTRRDWSEMSSQPGSKAEKVIRLAAGGDALYALTAEYDTLRLYTSTGSSWTSVNTSGHTLKELFGNNAVSTPTGTITDNRAFVTYEGGIEELIGGILSGAPIGTTGDAASESILTAAWAGTDTYLSESSILCSDGTNTFKPSNLPGIDDTKTVYSMCFSPSDSMLYAGTTYSSAGILKFPVSGSTVSPSLTLGSNADAVIGGYKVISVFATNSPDSITIYAGSVGTGTYQGSKNNCLWGYYSGRGNWNKE